MTASAFARDDAAPRRALLHAGGKCFDVLVLRETRGRYQIRLATSEPRDTRVVVSRGARVLTHGVTTSVPIGAVELR